MKTKKCIMAGILASAVFCQSAYIPGGFLVDPGISRVQAAEVNAATSKAATTAQSVLNSVNALDISQDGTQLQLPEMPEGYKAEVYGSEVKQVLAVDGTIAPLHIGDRSMNVILQVTNTTNSSDTAKKNFTVTVPENLGKYPELFPEVSAPNAVPTVLPSLQEWYGYEGDYIFTENTEIVYHDAANLGLAEVAEEMQTDLKEICGFAPAVKAGTSHDSDDIYLESLASDVYGTGDEGYLMVTDDKGIHISSSSRTGILYGTVTAEQILYQDPARRAVPKGVIRDYPLYGVRGVMMDVARIPTRMQFLQDYTKILKWYKLNEMQLHLNDNQWSDPAFSGEYEKWKEVEASHRLYSDTFPSLALQDSKFMWPSDQEGRYDYYYNVHTGMKEAHGQAGELYYTKDEYRNLQSAAGGRGINLVMELDTPGHATPYTKYVYENQEEVITSLVEKGYLKAADYLNADGSLKDGASFYIQNPNYFELLSIDDQSSNAQEKQNAVNGKIFMKALFDEYLGGDDPLVTCGKISAGVDEYWDHSKGNAFRRYMNFMQELLGDGYGKEVRMWGSLNNFQGTEVVDKDIVLDLWSVSEENPIARMNEGFRLINIPQPYLYTTPGRYHKDMIREEYLYENWSPEIFNGNVKADKGEPKLLGVKMALWGDENREGITEADLNERYLRGCAMVSEKSWGGTKSSTTFVDYEQKFDRLREGPGTKIANKIESKSNVVVDYDFANVSADKKTVYDASGNGYNGKINGGEVVEKEGETWLKFDGKTTVETPLTSLGYPYTMSFDIYLDGTEQNTKESALFSGYDGRLQISGLGGKLGLNRDYFTQSFDYQVEAAKKQRITIVGTYQVTKLYVDGVFKKILYAAASDKDNGGNIGASTFADGDNNFRTTFVFPMNVIGQDFSGYLGNIKAYNKALSTEELNAEGFISEGEADVARNRGAYTDMANSAFFGDEMRLYPAWKATDGDGHVTGASGVSVSNESRWNSSDNNADFLMVDLGAARKISKVVIDWEASRYAASYDLQVSDDAKKWTTVKSVTGNTNAMTTDTFEAVDARYVKMQGVQRKAGANEYCIYEMKVYGDVDKTALAASCEEAASMLAERKVSWGNADKLHRTYVLATAVLGDVMAAQEEVDAMLEVLEQVKAEKPEEPDKPGDTKPDVPGGKPDVPNPQPEKPAEALAAPKVTAVKSTATGVKVTWQKAEHAVSYQLYRKIGSKVTKVGTPVTGTSAYDKAPLGGKNMSYYVTALAGGQKGYKDSAAGVAKSIKLPKSTTSVTAAQQKGSRVILIKWKKAAKATSYVIYRAEGKKDVWKKVATVNKKKGTVYRDKKVKKGKTYRYSVVAVSAKKYSPMKSAKKSIKVK